MDAIIFLLAGVLFAFVSYHSRKARKALIAESHLVTGTTVAINKVTYKTQSKGHTSLVPTIEYKFGSTYRFNAEIDADQHGLKVGDTVDVQVSTTNPKVAQLKQGNKEFFLLMNALLFLGLVSCGLSVYLFDPTDLRLKDYLNPFTLLFIIASAFFLYVKALPTNYYSKRRPSFRGKRRRGHQPRELN